MKTRLLSFVFCIILSINVLQGQETENQENPNSVLLDFSVGISNNFMPTLSLKGIYSHKYNEHFALGVGTGIYYNSYKEEDIESFSLDLPLFVNIKGNIIKKKESSKISPYYSLSAGYFFNVMKAKDEYVVIKDVNYYGENNSYQITSLKYYEGLFFAPEIGININDMYIGIEFLCGTYKNEIHRNYIYPYMTSQEDTSSYNKSPSYVTSIKFVQKL